MFQVTISSTHGVLFDQIGVNAQADALTKIGFDMFWIQFVFVVVHYNAEDFKLEFSETIKESSKVSMIFMIIILVRSLCRACRALHLLLSELYFMCCRRIYETRCNLDTSYVHQERFLGCGYFSRVVEKDSRSATKQRAQYPKQCTPGSVSLASSQSLHLEASHLQSRGAFVISHNYI